MYTSQCSELFYHHDLEYRVRVIEFRPAQLFCRPQKYGGKILARSSRSSHAHLFRAEAASAMPGIYEYRTERRRSTKVI
jgi:hypothetical protein